MSAVHICTIDDATGDGWIDVRVTVDASLVVQEVTLTGATEDVRDQLTATQLDQLRVALARVRPQLDRQIREAAELDRAAEYWEGRAA